jgi:hypothetical protein
MRAFAGIVGLTSALAIACTAGGPKPLKLSKEPFMDTGLHRVDMPGRAQLLISPDLERVRQQLRETDGAILHCQVTVDEADDAPGLAPAKATLARDLCAAAQKGIVARPRPAVGPGSEAPARIVAEPGPGIMYVEVWLIGVEGDAKRLKPTPDSKFSLRLSESLQGAPVMRYYEDVGSAASGPIDVLVDRSLDRLYGVYDQVLDAQQPDVASPPR